MRPRTLRTNGEIRAVIESGIRVSADPFVIYFRRSKPGEEPALAIQVPRKLGCAVRRNRVRRIVKEVCRLAFPRFQRGGDFVFIARPGARDLGFHEVQGLLGRFFEREGFVRNG